MYLNIGGDIGDKYYDTISNVSKYAESGYYLIKYTSESCHLYSSQKLGKYVIKAGELVYDAVYLNSLANFKWWYTPYENEN